MSYRRRVYFHARRLKAKVIDNQLGNYQETIEVEAPNGYKWLDGDCEVLCGHWFKREKGSKPDAWKDLYDRIQFGLGLIKL